MAKKVIQMYDKYKSTTKIYPKVIKDCLQEDVTEYIEGQVVANPELAGTEAELSSIQVGDTKYKVGGGSQVYRHYINLIGGSSPNLYNIDIYIENDSNEEINTLAKLKTAIKNAGIYTNNNYRPVYPLVNGKHNTYFVVGVSNLNNDKLYIDYGTDFSQYEVTSVQISVLTDLVVEK